MIKKALILLITVFAFYAGVRGGNEFMDYIFRDYNASLAASIEEESSLAKDEESPKKEIEGTNENEDDIKLANTSAN